MIDTIILQIPYSDFKITNPEYFSPRALLNDNSAIQPELLAKDVYKEFTNRPSIYDKGSGIYKPSITIIQRMKKDTRELEWFLDIQFSVPKMLFGNNIREITENDSELVFKTLQSKIQSMGIKISIDCIRNGIVKKAHFGKNIQLKPEHSIYYALELIHRANTRAVKGRQVNYENGGEALHLLTSAHGIIFYDKLKDLERTKNVALDKDRTKNERSDGKLLRKSGAQILRFEIRYNTQQKISSKLREYLHTEKKLVLFLNLFSQKLWQNILISEWEGIIQTDAGQIAIKTEMEPKEILKLLIHKFSDQKNNVYGMTNTLALFGIFYGIQSIGANPLKTMFDQQFGYKTVKTRLADRIEELNTIIKNIPIDPIISYIDKEIHACKQITTYKIDSDIVY